MASREEIIKMLSTLGPREREVLSLVCQGKLYREIAKELFITEGAVKSTMAHVYVKLGLDQLKPPQRRKRLFQEFCPALATGAIPPQSDEDRRLVVIPSERVRAMVEKDEKALVRGQQRALAIRSGDQPRERPDGCWQRLWRGSIVVGLIAIGVVLGGLLLMVAYNVVTEGEIGLPDFGRGISETVIVTATPDAEQGIGVAEAAEPETPEPSPTPAPTETPSPTPTPTATPVPPTETPVPLPTATETPPPPTEPSPTSPPTEMPNTGLALDTWYSRGNVSMAVTSDIHYRLGDRGAFPHLGLKIPIRNISQSPISLEYGSWNFQLVDNMGNSYPSYLGDFSHRLTLYPGEMYRLYGTLGNQYVYFDVDFTNPAITQLTLIIRDVSSVSHAEWVIPISH